jgi:hypothetical protein
MKTLAGILLVLAIIFYGLLFAWLFQFVRVVGLINLPKVLIGLGPQAAIYGLGLGILGTTALCLGAVLASRKG